MEPTSNTANTTEALFDPLKVKRCSICGHVKSKDKFTKDTHRRDGLRIRCKSCDKRYQKFRAVVKSLDTKADLLEASPFLTNLWSLRYLYERVAGGKRPKRDGVLYVADIQVEGAFDKKKDGLSLVQSQGELFLKVWTPGGNKTFNLATIPSLQIAKELTAVKIHLLAAKKPTNYLKSRKKRKKFSVF